MLFKHLSYRRHVSLISLSFSRGSAQKLEFFSSKDRLSQTRGFCASLLREAFSFGATFEKKRKGFWLYGCSMSIRGWGNSRERAFFVSSFFRCPSPHSLSFMHTPIKEKAFGTLLCGVSFKLCATTVRFGELFCYFSSFFELSLLFSSAKEAREKKKRGRSEKSSDS